MLTAAIDQVPPRAGNSGAHRKPIAFMGAAIQPVRAIRQRRPTALCNGGPSTPVWR
jgi:hypothetical protein